MTQRKYIIYILLLLMIPFSVHAQYDFQKEKNKYWVYRERLKNFMVSSNGTGCTGCDIPANGRNNTIRDAFGNIIFPPAYLGWADSPWFMGYWIGTLAMEYQLLTKTLSSSSPEVMQTKEDLYGALQAINRIDWEADQVWGCSSCSGYTPCTSSINGFLLADDIPMDFCQDQNKIDGLNDGFVPPPDGFRDKCISSVFVDYVTPREASQDHLIGLYIGLALVKKCLPDWENWNNTNFTNGNLEINTSSFKKEVQIISTRIITNLVTHAWIYWNPCLWRCVIGDNGEPNINACDYKSGSTWDATCYNSSTPSCCSQGGAIALPQAIGFAAADQYIQDETLSPYLVPLLSNPINWALWNAAINDGNRLVMTLVAISNIWKVGICEYYIPITSTWDLCLGLPGCWTPPSWHCCYTTTIEIPYYFPCISTTSDITNHLINAGVNNHWEHLYLLHELLHGNGSSSNTIDPSYYQCLLDAAPCRGIDGTNDNDNVEWGWTDRLSGDRNDGSHGTNSSADSKVDYMFYFNLYNLATNISGDYRPIPIKQLAPVNVIKPDADIALSSYPYKEYDKKNFIASQTITAHDYVISSLLSEGQGRVTFSAGHTITLSNGFKVTNGGYFHGNIDPSIGAMDCSDPPSQTNCGNAYIDGRLTLAQDTITDADSVIIIPFPDTLIGALSCPIDTLHPHGRYLDSTATSFYWDFGNGQTSSLENPSIYYSSSGNYLLTIIVTSPNKIDTIRMHIIVPDCNILHKSTNQNQQTNNNTNNLNTGIKIIPNPNNGNMNVSYEIPTAETGVLEIYNSLGIKLYSYPLFEGKNTFTISETEIDAGIYFYRATANNKVFAKDKIVVIK